MMQRQQDTPPETDQISLENATVIDLADAAEHAFSIQERFERFNRSHPEVYDDLLRLCKRWRLAGRGSWSIKGAFEVLRWERHISGLEDDFEVYRLNNNYTARYAHKLMRENRELEGLFELRDLRS